MKNYKTLVFDSAVSGHHLEYLHHLYTRALKVASRERQFVFAVPREFVELSKKREWQENENIIFVFFDVPAKPGAYWQSKKLGDLVREYCATEVLLVSLMGALPWLPVFMPRGVKVSGIIYMIYLYRWTKAGFKTKWLDVLKYLMFKYCSCIDRVFLLNDKVAPRYLNKLYKTDKFEFLPDPIAIDGSVPVRDIRNDSGVPAGMRIFSHFGGLSGRKGTLDILETINAFPQRFKNDCFVFAGKVGKDIRDNFYKLLVSARERGANVIVKDEFVSYEFLKSLSACSTAVLIPYHNTEQSSGVIAYAAAAGVPVIAPKSGLLGKLIKRYRLGFFLEDFCGNKLKDIPAGTSSRAIAIAESLADIDEKALAAARRAIRGNDYLRDNSLEEFQEIIIKR